MRVVVSGRDVARLGTLADELGDACVAQAGDVGDWEAQRGLAALAVEHFGRLDVAFANAGHTTAGDLEDGNPEAWREMILTNVLGAALTIKACLPEVRRHRGHVVLSGSVAGRRATPGNLYGATKWAITGLGESLRQQLNGSGARVTVVHPGRVDTPFWESSPPAALTADDVARTVMWVLEQPAHVDVNDVLLRPTDQDI